MARSNRSRSPSRPGADSDFTEALVNALAEFESAKTSQLAEKLGVKKIKVRNALVELEKLGIVYRTGQTRGTRWWLG